MTIFDDIATLYFSIDADLLNKELECRIRRYTRKEAEFQNRRALNDMAYFLFLFTRFEDRVNLRATQLIAKKKTTIWSQKRAWEILDKNHKAERLFFMDKVALLTEKGNQDYNLINSYYDQRNRIAHGKTFTVAIDIGTVLQDFKRLYQIL